MTYCEVINPLHHIDPVVSGATLSGSVSLGTTQSTLISRGVQLYEAAKEVVGDFIKDESQQVCVDLVQKTFS